MERGPSNNASNKIDPWKKAKQKDFMISCAIGVVGGIGFWYFGGVMLAATLLAKIGVVLSPTTVGAQVGFSALFGGALTFGGAQKIMELCVFGLEKFNSVLKGLNRKLEFPEQKYKREKKAIKASIGYLEFRLASQEVLIQPIIDELKELKIQIPNASFDDRGKATSVQPPFNRYQFYQWENELLCDAHKNMKNAIKEYISKDTGIPVNEVDNYEMNEASKTMVDNYLKKTISPSILKDLETKVEEKAKSLGLRS